MLSVTSASCIKWTEERASIDLLGLGSPRQSSRKGLACQAKGAKSVSKSCSEKCCPRLEGFGLYLMGRLDVRQAIPSNYVWIDTFMRRSRKRGRWSTWTYLPIKITGNFACCVTAKSKASASLSPGDHTLLSNVPKIHLILPAS